MESLIPLQDILSLFNLKPLPHEGGYYREFYISSEGIDACKVDKRYTSHKIRPISGAIFYIITPESFSALHKLKTDEIWHFYYGDSAEQLCLYPNGGFEVVDIGSDFLAGEVPARVVPGDSWQGTRLKPGGRYALCGTTMAPAYQSSDFQLGVCEELIRSYPSAEALIRKFLHE